MAANVQIPAPQQNANQPAPRARAPMLPPDLYLFDPAHHLVGAWLATLRAQQYDDHEAQINIPARMGGDAHHWYNTYVWVDLPTFERDFMNRFDYVHPEQALYMIKDRVQKPLESVAEYRNRFYRMFVKTERGEQVGRDLFIDGLRSRTIRTKLRKQFSPITRTLQQIMAAAEEMERKFVANFLEGEDYPRDGDLTELVRARAELSALQNKFENMGFWVRCPMGICNAPATFQRAMNMTFQNFVNKTRLTQGMINFCVIVYMDDILVYSEIYHGHAQHIEWTSSALRDAGFKIALVKSEFFLSEISFLSYIVTRGGLRPDSRKVAAVKEAPVPTSLTQAWRTNVEGELLVFLFGTVRPGHQELITQELTIPVAQLADDLPLDVISQDDEHPVPHVLSRTLTPHLQWSACVEGVAEQIPPSHRQHLDPRAIRDPAFFRQPTAEQFAAFREEEEEEESTESDKNGGGLEESGGSEEVSGENENPEEGSYSEHSEGEQSEEKEEDEEEDEGHEEESAGSEWEAVPEEALRTGTEAEDPEAARKREEIAARKTELELAGAASLQICDDPNRDPEPPQPEDGNIEATTPAPSARR
ncbi:hypothetical protein CBR_g22392 [Chara braunii]|uniref:Reverse transcriptase domain-containing protein n=1 Tax=Chara braunii TaxID=69332 RepID=A0A388JUY1_CHABU|nr:hypothetical protein CBR_g22392 [Chara braunii]|eukprot:GBG61595.1 hypothetical protein CBR_g22392 [Chara braunii]